MTPSLIHVRCLRNKSIPYRLSKKDLPPFNTVSEFLDRERPNEGRPRRRLEIPEPFTSVDTETKVWLWVTVSVVHWPETKVRMKITIYVWTLYEPLGQSPFPVKDKYRTRLLYTRTGEGTKVKCIVSVVWTRCGKLEWLLSSGPRKLSNTTISGDDDLPQRPFIKSLYQVTDDHPVVPRGLRRLCVFLYPEKNSRGTLNYTYRYPEIKTYIEFPMNKHWNYPWNQKFPIMSDYKS